MYCVVSVVSGVVCVVNKIWGGWRFVLANAHAGKKVVSEQGLDSASGGDNPPNNLPWEFLISLNKKEISC